MSATGGSQTGGIEPLDSATIQKIYLIVTGTLCLCILGLFAILGVAVFFFGDGEGQKIIGDLTPALIAAFGSMVAMVVGPHFAGLLSSKSQPILTPLPSVPTVTTVPVTVLTPSGQQVGSVQSTSPTPNGSQTQTSTTPGG